MAFPDELFALQVLTKTVNCPGKGGHLLAIEPLDTVVDLDLLSGGTVFLAWVDLGGGTKGLLFLLVLGISSSQISFNFL